MKKALVAYTTRGGSTRELAETIAEGIRFEGLEAEVVNISEIKDETGLTGYDAYIFGSPTYHGEMVQPMKTFLFLAEKADLAGKTGGAFGAFGWSGEAPERIFQTMKNIFNMNMVGNALRLKSVALGGGLQMAQEYGRQVGKKAGASS
ncbi:MAG: FprA family A-type flavoprotein [Deltaproteobacteria bacterium]|nr:FprA family A-type flavoprotein [Deltaproteobacteria bacterium]